MTTSPRMSFLQSFVVSQDTGAAVLGRHADLFLGAGAEADARAGAQRAGRALFLAGPLSGRRQVLCDGGRCPE